MVVLATPNCSAAHQNVSVSTLPLHPQMKEELKQQMEAAVFKARPNTVVYKEPFLPKKENRSIVGECMGCACVCTRGFPWLLDIF